VLGTQCALLVSVSLGSICRKTEQIYDILKPTHHYSVCLFALFVRALEKICRPNLVDRYDLAIHTSSFILKLEGLKSRSQGQQEYPHCDKKLDRKRAFAHGTDKGRRGLAAEWPLRVPSS